MDLYAATGDGVALIGPESRLVMEGSGTQCVAVDPSAPRRVYVGTFDEGLHRSNDGGRSWERVGADVIHPRVLSVAFSPSHISDGRSVVYAGTEPSMLYRSIDDGRTWESFPAMAELPSASTWSFPPRPWTHHVRWIAPHHQDPDLLFVGIELGGVLTTRDGGRTWEDRRTDACIDPHVLRTHPVDGDRVYEVAGDGVAYSLDAGGSWRRDVDGMDRFYSWGLAVDPADPDLWYVSAAPGPDRAHARGGNAEARLYRKRGSSPFEALTLDGRGDLLGDMPYSLLCPGAGALVVGLDSGELLLSEDEGDSFRDLGVRLPGILQIASSNS